MSGAFEQGLRRHLSKEQIVRLAAARVGLAGAGGLGSNCAMMLARSGLKQLVLVDGDVVDASNLNRQHFFPMDHSAPPSGLPACSHAKWCMNSALARW
jgi:sulfur carrier protein ThiS adenylyltransferase